MTKDAFLQRSSSMCTYTLMFDGGDFLHATKKFFGCDIVQFSKRGGVIRRVLLAAAAVIPMRYDDGRRTDGPSVLAMCDCASGWDNWYCTTMFTVGSNPKKVLFTSTNTKITVF